MITVVDYGVGNIGALLNMFDYLGLDASASAGAREIANAQHLVLPGVGAFDKAMATLRSKQLIEPLNEAVIQRGVPVLGICLGMQLLSRSSEEGTEPGLGWIAADVRRIAVPPDSPLKVPHIGWAEIHPVRDSYLFQPTFNGERFYFVHSYHVVCDDTADVTAVFDYDQTLTCAVSRGNIHGVQFHPEKSHRFGMRLLRTFGDIATMECTE